MLQFIAYKKNLKNSKSLLSFIILVINLILPITLFSQLNTSLYKAIDQRTKQIEQKLIDWRRDIHQHPELGEQEFRTAQIIANHLKSLGMEVQTGVAVTGVVGLLKGGKPGPVVGLRADMDALPVKEQVDVAFASKAKGIQMNREVDLMHACGHDAHVAMLMAVAEVLAGMRDQIPGSVKFIFQPAEEGPSTFESDGKRIWGANLMVQEGVLDNPKVDAIFGIHVTSRMYTGMLAWRSGPSMAASDFFDIQVIGKQTHGSTPWQGVDPIVASAQIISNLQTIVSRQIDITEEPAVLTIGTIEGGTRNNIIPDKVQMSGTIRTFDEQMRNDIHYKVREIVEGVAKSSGVKVNVKIIKQYDVTNNDPKLTEKMSSTLYRVVGKSNCFQATKSTGAEDFSFYQKKIPGLYIYMGITPKGQDLKTVGSNHSPFFYIDEPSLIIGVRALANLTIDYLLNKDNKK